MAVQLAGFVASLENKGFSLYLLELRLRHKDVAVRQQRELSGELDRARVAPMCKPNALFFFTKIPPHAFNEYMLIKFARILLASFFIALWFFRNALYRFF